MHAVRLSLCLSVGPFLLVFLFSLRLLWMPPCAVSVRFLLEFVSLSVWGCRLVSLCFVLSLSLSFRPAAEQMRAWKRVRVGEPVRAVREVGWGGVGRGGGGGGGGGGVGECPLGAPRCVHHVGTRCVGKSLPVGCPWYVVSRGSSSVLYQ